MRGEVFPMWVPNRTGNGPLADHLDERLPKASAEVGTLQPEDLVGARPTLVADTLVARYSARPFRWSEAHVLDRPQSKRTYQCDSPTCVRLGSPLGRHSHTVDMFHAVIDVLDGDMSLLRFRPTGGRGPFIDQDFVGTRGRAIVVEFARQDARDARRTVSNIVELLEQANVDIEHWNDRLRQRIEELIGRRTMRLAEDADAVAAFGFPVRRTNAVRQEYRIPDQRRESPRSTPAPLEAEIDWQLSRDDFAAVLGAIRTWADAAERLPGVAAGKGEDAHRNALLASLRVRFVDGTGEAFSVRGKTDLRILVRTQGDGLDQVFHAECKIWDGPGCADEAFDQLVLQYSTYRDRLGALIFFVVDRADPLRIPAKAVARLVADYKGEERPHIAGWPVVSVPDPAAPGRKVELAIVAVHVPGLVETAKP